MIHMGYTNPRLNSPVVICAPTFQRFLYQGYL